MIRHPQNRGMGQTNKMIRILEERKLKRKTYEEKKECTERITKHTQFTKSDKEIDIRSFSSAPIDLYNCSQASKQIALTSKKKVYGSQAVLLPPLLDSVLFSSFIFPVILYIILHSSINRMFDKKKRHEKKTL